MSEERAANVSKSDDNYLAQLREAKTARVVVKTEFAAHVASIPDEYYIFAFEGVGDKYVYYHWIKALRPRLRYEPYICGNKAKVLQLFDALTQDLTGLNSRVYYFVDRDFDELQGRPQHRNVFVTTKYSIENYIVSSQVLEDVLTVELHCNGAPETRESVKALFLKVYHQFLTATMDINLRLFVSKRLQISRSEKLPDKINMIADVRLTEVHRSEQLAEDLVKLQREPTEEEMATQRALFQRLIPMDEFRGKFALLFFTRWLRLLRGDRVSNESEVFRSLPVPPFSINGEYSLGTLAPKAHPPAELCLFLRAIA